MQICRHEVEVKYCADCLPQAVMKAARKLFTARGRYNSQVAMCELGDMLGYPVAWPKEERLINHWPGCWREHHACAVELLDLQNGKGTEAARALADKEQANA